MHTRKDMHTAAMNHRHTRALTYRGQQLRELSSFQLLEVYENFVIDVSSRYIFISLFTRDLTLTRTHTHTHNTHAHTQARKHAHTHGLTRVVIWEKRRAGGGRGGKGETVEQGSRARLALPFHLPFILFCWIFHHCSFFLVDICFCCVDNPLPSRFLLFIYRSPYQFSILVHFLLQLLISVLLDWPGFCGVIVIVIIVANDNVMDIIAFADGD